MHLLTHIVNRLTSRPRIEYQGDREYLVAPVVMAREGVLNGHRGPALYPAKVLGKNPTRWNGMPVTLNHPKRKGRNVSAAIAPAFIIGFIANAKYADGLRAEIWLDTDRTPESVLQRIHERKPVEVSTGLATRTVNRSGTFNGRGYDELLVEFIPDHLAILTREIGACSVADGCGVTANAVECDCGCGGDCEGVQVGDDRDTYNTTARPIETALELPELFPGDVVYGNAAPLGLPVLFDDPAGGDSRDEPLGLPKLFH